MKVEAAMRNRHALMIWIMLTAVGCTAPAASIPVKISVAGGSYTNVKSTMLKEMLLAKDFILINVHTPYEGEIAQTDLFIPYDRVGENQQKLPSNKNARILLYCRSGRMSAMTAEDLVSRGYSNIWNLDGGMVEWEIAGLPVIHK